MSDGAVAGALASSPRPHPTIHIVNAFEQPHGGSELHALDLATRLAAHTKTKLWAPETPHPRFTEAFGIKGIDPSQGRAPVAGVVVLVGIYFPIRWLADARPDRIIILYNTFEAPTLYQRVAETHALTGVRPELLFCSAMMGRECGLPGLFEPSPIDIDRYRPLIPTGERPFSVGRHSRDVFEKHHGQDAVVYQAVAERGGRSVLLGATCMRAAFTGVPALDLRPAQADGVVTFLQGLDAFFYRTSTWVEPWGRVVTEAMACGLPVLVHDVGGYAEIIDHERNGLLFHTTDEAVRLMQRLIDDPRLRDDLSRAARETVEQLLGSAAMNRLAMFYLASA